MISGLKATVEEIKEGELRVKNAHKDTCFITVDLRTEELKAWYYGQRFIITNCMCIHVHIRISIHNIEMLNKGVHYYGQQFYLHKLHARACTRIYTCNEK